MENNPTPNNRRRNIFIAVIVVIFLFLCCTGTVYVADRIGLLGNTAVMSDVDEPAAAEEPAAEAADLIVEAPADEEIDVSASAVEDAPEMEAPAEEEVEEFELQDFELGGNNPTVTESVDEEVALEAAEEGDYSVFCEGVWGILFMDETGLSRPVQAANTRNLSWTSLNRWYLNGELIESVEGLAEAGVVLREPTVWTITNNNSEPQVVGIQMMRDFLAEETCGFETAYTDALGDAGPNATLGWFLTGDAEVSATVDGVLPLNDAGEEMFFDGAGSFQLEFPRDMKGAYFIEVTLDPGGYFELYQGPITSDNNTWELPEVPEGN